MILYTLVVIAGVTVYCYGLKRRKYFPIRAIATVLMLSIYNLLLRRMIFDSPIGSVFGHSAFFVDWALLFAAIFVSFDIQVVTVAFVTTCCYCLQHITQRINFLLTNVILGASNSPVLNVVCYTLTAIVVLTLFAALYKKEKPNASEEPLVDDLRQFIATIVSLFVSLGVESFAGADLFASGSRTLIVGNFMTSILFAALIMMLEYNILFRRRATDENIILRQMIIKEQEQYQTEQNVIEALNIKVHDMKNRLAVQGEILDLEETEEFKESASIYDSLYKTGNKVLDTVLTMKGLECKNKGIEFTCLTDGRKLTFMRESDTYSLFLNLLNNCIEAVENLPPELRAISLNVISRGAGLQIITENYFEGDRVFVNGLSQTTKQNKQYHGYGLKSIQRVAEKYGGELQIKAEQGIFTVSILFL